MFYSVLQLSKNYIIIIIISNDTRGILNNTSCVNAKTRYKYMQQERNRIMITDDIFIKFGFVKESDELRLKQMIQNKNKLKEIHIDAYSENPLISSSHFMLLLRVSERNAKISIDDDRLVFKRNDGCETHFVNVLISQISECFSKIGSNYSEFILNIQNVYYRITVFN